MQRSLFKRLSDIRLVNSMDQVIELLSRANYNVCIWKFTIAHINILIVIGLSN